MRILCLNCWGGVLAEALLPWIGQTGADVLCLQEVIETVGATAPWLEYRDGAHVLPQRANLMAEIAAQLPDHAGTFCPAAEGPLWDGERAIASRWGIATFVHRRLVRIGQVQGFVHGDFAKEGFGDHPRARNGHGVRVYDRQACRTVAITQMHGLRDLSGKHDTPARLAQVKAFLRLSDSLARPGDFRVLCGDFNVGPESETLRFLTDAGFADLVTTGDHLGTRTSHYAKQGRFADYLLVDQPQAVRSFEVIRAPEVSDHCALLLDV